MKIEAIHQFSPSVSFGDGITNSLFLIQKMLREFGFKSNIYSNHIEEKLKNRVLHIGEYDLSEEQILLYHFAIGHIHHHLIMQFPDKKILIYHNITPKHFFLSSPFLMRAIDLGREQIESSKERFISSIADSDYNKKELLSFGYKNVKTLSLLVNLNRYKNIKPNKKILKEFRESLNILFVGRIVTNKFQHQLIDTLYFLKKRGYNFKLILVGGVSEPKYLDYLSEKAKNLDLQQSVIFVNKVKESDLVAYYRVADIYLSLSEHEGFSMPLIEAMSFDTLTLAYNIGGVETSISPLGKLNKKSPNFVADEVISLLKDSNRRKELIKSQREHLKKFTFENLKKEFYNYLKELNIEIPKKLLINGELNSKKSIQIEGAFDSSYSLAIVNRELAKAFKRDNYLVKLYSTEGFGDFKPNRDFLNRDREIKELYQNRLSKIDITIRNLYPPRTDNIVGVERVIGPYGWEESQFPEEWVELFNSRLTHLFCMSNFVKDVMVNSGVTIPISVTGLGVEHILEIKPKFYYNLPKGFKFLHISSAFPRKGVDILLKLFNELNLESTLIIKTFPNPHNSIKEQIRELKFKLKEEIGKEIFLYEKENMKIFLINRDISQAEINYLYQNSNLLIAPSRGEGFGLPMAEAMLFNLPVITTNYGGAVDFCNNENSYLIDFKFAKAETHFNLENSIWVEPKEKSLKEAILRVYNGKREEIEEKTKRAKEEILKFSWERVSKIIIEELNRPQIKKKKRVGVVSTFNTKCGIAKYTSYLISNFIEKVTIFANYTDETIEEERENIVRCWEIGEEKRREDFTNLKEKIEGITHLIIQYNFSFFPLKLLGELLEYCYKNSIKTYLFIHSAKDVKHPHKINSFSQIANSLQKATRVVTLSIEDINILKEFNIYKNSMLFPHGVDTSLLKRKGVISYKPKYFNRDIATIASFGFLLPHKGIEELIKAVEIVSEKKPIQLLLLNALYPAEISKLYQKHILNIIENSPIRDRIAINTNFLRDEDIVYTLSKCSFIIYPYQTTQEASSAAVRMGILSKKPVITTPLPIFNDIKEITYQTEGVTPEEIAEEILKGLSQPHLKLEKQVKWIEKFSWNRISKRLWRVMQ